MAGVFVLHLSFSGTGIRSTTPFKYLKKAAIYGRSAVWAGRAEVHVSERRKKIFPPEPSRAIVSGFVEPVRVISVPSLSGWAAETPPKRKEFASCELTGASIVYGIRNVELILN